jgi:hypothetical protein
VDLGIEVLCPSGLGDGVEFEVGRGTEVDSGALNVFYGMPLALGADGV